MALPIPPHLIPIHYHSVPITYSSMFPDYDERMKEISEDTLNEYNYITKLPDAEGEWTVTPPIPKNYTKPSFSYHKDSTWGDINWDRY